MSNKRSKKRAKPFTELLEVVASKLRPPFGMVLGSPRETSELVKCLPEGEIVCYQMDIHQAHRLAEEVRENKCSATIASRADLWDLPAAIQTLIYPIPYGGERSLKLDMIEQAYHVLKPQGTLVVLSPYEKDDFIPRTLKKVFGRVHTPMEGDNAVFWVQRGEDQPQRRHEMTYHVRVAEDTSYCFVSRPGVFGYGFFDEGARALTETMELSEGQRVLDMGCGVGTIGIIAARQLGSDGFVAFADSNVRAVQLAELNARAMGLTNFEIQATETMTEWPNASFDVVLANPPYYAHGGIIRHFISRGKALLRRGGVFYLVTKQVDATLPFIEEHFAEPELFESRGYIIFRAVR